MDKYYTSPEVAKMTKSSRHTARLWANKHGVWKPNQDYLWAESDIAAYKKRNKKLGRPKGGGIRHES